MKGVVVMMKGVVVMKVVGDEGGLTLIRPLGGAASWLFACALVCVCSVA